MSWCNVLYEERPNSMRECNLFVFIFHSLDCLGILASALDVINAIDNMKNRIKCNSIRTHSFFYQKPSHLVLKVYQKNGSIIVFVLFNL
jgi:hypothetical protein